mmetsp:Transcript_8023/g.26407  ORF Transcript_8023/g.26407 Transcript_8023/m.26407 type:complete len:215 (+) Transcript_8023:383-1027(+)
MSACARAGGSLERGWSRLASLRARQASSAASVGSACAFSPSATRAPCSASAHRIRIPPTATPAALWRPPGAGLQSMACPSGTRRWSSLWSGGATSRAARLTPSMRSMAASRPQTASPAAERLYRDRDQSCIGSGWKIFLRFPPWRTPLVHTSTVCTPFFWARPTWWPGPAAVRLTGKSITPTPSAISRASTPRWPRTSRCWSRPCTGTGGSPGC